MKDVSKLIENKTCLAIMGPTASGKSRLSMALAAELPIEIISVDSALVYKGLDIGSAKPSAAEMAEVPHHLIDVIGPEQSYSAADFVADVHELVEAIFARGHLPVLVGGTMMYFNALQKGMAKLPSADEAVRSKIYQAWSENPEAVHAQLQSVDPEAAERIHPNDPQRLIRALEVYELTGRPLSALQKEQQDNCLTAFKLKKIVLMAEDRAKLHAQIEQRFHEMLEQDFISEVKELRKNDALHEDLPSIRSVGYRQAWQYLSGQLDYDAFVQKGIVATRQLAKRQITWLRKEQDVVVIDPFVDTLEKQIERVLSALKLS